MRIILLALLVLIAGQAYSQYKEDMVICGPVVEDAKYPGDSVALSKHFAKIRYPEKSRRTGVAGTVLVQYVVDTSGNIQEAKIMKGVNDEINREALRLVYTQKKWTPTTYNGRKVKSYKKREIEFKIQR